eukprot:4805886-Amphidinium_carterae.1
MQGLDSVEHHLARVPCTTCFWDTTSQTASWCSNHIALLTSARPARTSCVPAHLSLPSKNINNKSSTL